jgi:hypothetical protein
MKIRIGFVSNSSSSSFVILGTKTHLGNISPKSVAKGEIIAVGIDLYGDGADLFYLTEDMYKTLQKNKHQKLDFYQVYAIDSGNEETEVIKAALPDKFNIFSFEASLHGTRTIEDFEERYIK